MKRLGVLCGVVFLLLSCEKEVGLEERGEKVAVHVSLDDIVYKGDETVTRGYSSMLETIRVPLGDDLYMFTTIEEDMEVPTRAGVALEEGVMVRVVAYNGSTAESTTEYTVTGGALVTATALEVNMGTNYKFVAYSYNDATSPTYPGPKITVAPPHDLLWGMESKLITASDNSVSITMSHLFAQVKVKATTTGVEGQPNITNMTGVTVTPGNAMDLTIETGVVEPNAAVATQSVSPWSAWNNKTVTSNPITVNTGTANPIYVNIGSVTLVGYSPFTNLKAQFNKALAAGSSYTLVVNFQKTDFAWSNIYWVSTGGNDGYLTFDKGTSGHEMYQGVFFKWGSLVGISPTGGTGEYFEFDNTVPIYKPTSATTFTRTTTANWSDIKAMSLPANVAAGGVTNYVLNQGNSLSAMTGDICNFIDANYRLPNWGDFYLSLDYGSTSGSFSWNASSPILGGWKSIGGTWSMAPSPYISSTNDEGTYMIPRGASLRGITSFPASGYRSEVGSGGSLYCTFGYQVGVFGYYWSAYVVERSSAIHIPILSYNGSIMSPVQGSSLKEAYAIRCIKN
jgi:hypothetical protein